MHTSFHRVRCRLVMDAYQQERLNIGSEERTHIFCMRTYQCASICTRRDMVQLFAIDFAILI